MKKILVSQTDLAKFENLSTRRVRELMKHGVFSKEPSGKYDLLKSNHSFIAHLRKQVEGDEMKAAKLRRELSKARLSELETAEKEKSLILRGEAIQWLSGVISEAKAGFRNVPYRLSPVLVGQDEKTIFLILRREIDGILRTLAGAEKGKIPEVAPWDVELVRKGIIQGDERGEVVLITSAPPFRKRVKVADIIKETEGSLPQNQSVNQEGGG